MTTKADFNAEEWSTVVEGPLLAAMRVVTADRGGTIRESLAVGQVYGEARKQAGQSELLDELVASPPGMDASRLQQRGDLEALADGRLGEALTLLEQKATPDEVEAYKRFTLSAADAAARAHKEGGFLGIGGKEVSEREQAALDAIAAKLGISPAAAGG
jgi:hypothetical protein